VSRQWPGEAFRIAKHLRGPLDGYSKRRIIALPGAVRLW